MIDIRAHNCDHGGEACSLGKIADNLSSLNSCIVIFIDEHWLNDDENFMNERPDQVIKFVENTIDDFYQQVSLLRILVGHE